MNIGAIGWWHHDNQGDLAMLATLRHQLAQHKIIPLDTDLAYNQDTLARLNRLDFLLLGGGTLIRGRPLPLFRDFRHWGSHLQTPLGVLGLGVTHVEPDSAADVRALIEQARFFYVRDEVSRRLLDHPAVDLAPDLTLACPLPLSAKPLSEGRPPLCGLNLRQSHELDMDAWVAALRRLPCHWRALPLSSFSAWQEQAWLQELDPDSAAGFSADLYDGLDLVIGTALHAVIFAVQAGVPVIAIDYAAKVRRFMAEIGLEDYVLAADGMAELPAVYDRLLARHGEVRQQMEQERERLVRQSQEMFAAVRSAIVEAGVIKHYPAAKVSVVVVTTDRPAGLEQTLVSCWQQTYANIEIRVAGNRTASLAERLNEALANVSGEYVTWITAGDCLAADAIDVLVERLEQAGADLVYADIYEVENGQIVGQRLAHPAYKLTRHNVVTPCFLYRRALHETAGSYDPQSPLPVYDFWLRLAAGHRLCPVHTPLLMAKRRVGATAPRLERAIRRHYLESRPLVQRLLWEFVDNPVADQLLIKARGMLRPAADVGQ
jgi:hypothetical protein